MKKSRLPANADRHVRGEVRVADRDDARLGLAARNRARPATAVAGGGGVTVAGADTAAPSVIGPCLSPLSALNADLRLAGEQTDEIGFGPALRAGVHERLRGVAVRAAFDRRHRSRHRIGGDDAEALGDRRAADTARATGTDASLVPIIWPMPLASSTTSLPALMPQSARNCVSSGCGRWPFSSGSSITITLPPLARRRRSARRSPAGRSRSSDPAITTMVASAGTVFCWISTSCSTAKLSGVQPLGERRYSPCVRWTRCPSRRVPA